MGGPFDLIIFDCDGVLVDSEVISAQTLIELVEPFGFHLTFTDVQQHFVGRSFPTVAATLRSEFDVTLPPEFEATYRQILLERFDTELVPTPGIESALASLDLPFCAATSSSPPRVARSLELTGLAEFFGDRVFTASQVENGKPAPDLFFFAARQLGIAPTRCLVIEDSVPGVQAAHAAGMSVLRYTGGSHLSGLDLSGDNIGRPVRSFDSWANFSDTLAAEAGSLKDDGQ